MWSRLMIAALAAATLTASAACPGDRGPSAAETERFAALCQATSDASCTSDQTECREQWAFAARVCETEVNALLDCAGDQPTVTCGMQGVPFVDGCEPESTAAVLCATSAH